MISLPQKLTLGASSLIALSLLAFACSPSDGETSRQQGLQAEELEQDQAAESGAEAQGGAGGAGNRLDCNAAPDPSSGSCEPVDPNNTCQACVAEKCCLEQARCNSTDPENACSFGSILLSGSAVEGGEIACMMECFATREEAGELTGSEEDVTACSNQCAASECGASSATQTTQDFAQCILGSENSENFGCMAECGFLP